MDTRRKRGFQDKGTLSGAAKSVRYPPFGRRARLANGPPEIARAPGGGPLSFTGSGSAGGRLAAPARPGEGEARPNPVFARLGTCQLNLGSGVRAHG
jgi:hypothetical protein